LIRRLLSVTSGLQLDGGPDWRNISRALLSGS